MKETPYFLLMCKFVFFFFKLDVLSVPIRQSDDHPPLS